MKAVNLIPSDTQRSGGPSLKLAPATYALLGVLAAAVVLATLYVLAGNTVSSRKVQLASLQSQLAAAQSEAAKLTTYADFASVAQTRVENVRGIAATRFDWNAALSNLARVVPTDTSLQTLSATVVPGASAGGGGGGGGGLRADLPGPAFEMTGCTASQDEVARLISRLRTMPKVTRVALSSSSISGSSSGSTPIASGATSGSGTATTGCKPKAPTFNLTVFFQPVPNAGPTGPTAIGAAPSTGASATTTGASPTTPAGSSSSVAGGAK